MFAVSQTVHGCIRSSKTYAVELTGPHFSRAVRIACMFSTGRASRYAWTARWKSRLSNNVRTVASSGTPSKNRKVPTRVCTWSGDSMPGGMGVAFVIAGLLVTMPDSDATNPCTGPQGPKAHSSAPARRSPLRIGVR
ncbi:hypothetical protein JOJ87_003834 [Rhodococcus ruber]|nr:hypothetical protein [Rhodococcus ruber]